MVRSIMQMRKLRQKSQSYLIIVIDETRTRIVWLHLLAFLVDSSNDICVVSNGQYEGFYEVTK